MLSQKKIKYFDATEYRDTRDELKLGVKLAAAPKVAIDCGCGAGSDIAFLRSEGFLVHAFDSEAEAILRCKRRFQNDDGVKFTHATFSNFAYPQASLVLAESSLFFCPEKELDNVWQKITNALSSGGIFVGSFLGEEDTMAGPDYDKKAYWPEVVVASEKNIRHWLRHFSIESFSEYKTSGETPSGEAHQWHIYSVVAKKVLDFSHNQKHDDVVAPMVPPVFNSKA